MNLVPIQITIQAATAADVRQLVHDLAGTMTTTTINPVDVPVEQPISTVLEVDGQRIAVAVTPPPATPSTPPVEEDKPATIDPVPSDVELRALASEKAKSAGKPAIKALLDKYGAASVTAVPNESRAAFKADLEAL